MNYQKIILTLLILSFARSVKVETIFVQNLLLKLNNLFEGSKHYEPGNYDYRTLQPQSRRTTRQITNRTNEDTHQITNSTTNITNPLETISRISLSVSSSTTSSTTLLSTPFVPWMASSSKSDLITSPPTISSSMATSTSFNTHSSTLDSITSGSDLTSSSILTNTTKDPPLTRDEKNEEKKISKRCVFFRLHGETRLSVEPNSSDKECLESRRLKQEIVEQNGSLPLYRDNDNIMKVNLQYESLNSFALEVYWIKLNSTAHKPTDNYGMLLTIYENFELMGEVFLVDKLVLNKSKEIKFNKLGDLNNLTYTVGLSKVNYFRGELDEYLNKNSPENAQGQDFYLINDVYKSLQSVKLDEAPLDSNGQILIYTISSFLLLALVIGLLYYRRDKIRSLINNRFDNSPRHQNSKYVRKEVNPAINISNYENRPNQFEQQFLKSTAQLNNGDRLGGFGLMNSNYQAREKGLMSKISIGRVIEQSVATIKKRASMQPMSQPPVAEFDLKKMNSKYSQSIPLIEFLPLLNELIKSNNQKLFNEFIQLDILCNGFNTFKKTSNKVARISKNLQKNKDGCILPYDHSRVILEMNRFLTSDYINASYISGVNSSKEYIACQCPLKSTAYAFWLMCIQQNVKYVVMTTQLIDSHTTMDKYWPDLFLEDGESLKQIENIMIKLIDKRKFNNYTVRTFEVKMNDECRLIKHFQLTEWNEKSGPQNILMIAEFLRVFRDEIGFNEPILSNNSLNESPIVVHCSNGVGKTAVFIAIDRIFVQLKKGKNDHIDIFGTVIELRQYRPSMIQNEAQYKLIYECVGELVKRMYPNLVKQMEFDRTLDDINLKDTNDFDANNNLNSSNNSQIFLINTLRNLGDKPPPGIRLNGFTNHTFISNDERNQ